MDAAALELINLIWHHADRLKKTAVSDGAVSINDLSKIEILTEKLGRLTFKRG